MLDSELTLMRAEIEALLPDTANILEVTRVSDGQGGYNDSWGTATGGTAVACRLDAAASAGISNFQGNEVMRGGAVQPYGRWVATLPYNTTITTDNRLEINTRTFNVIALDTNKSWQLNVRVILEQL